MLQSYDFYGVNNVKAVSMGIFHIALIGVDVFMDILCIALILVYVFLPHSSNMPIIHSIKLLICMFVCVILQVVIVIYVAIFVGEHNSFLFFTCSWQLLNSWY